MGRGLRVQWPSRRPSERTGAARHSDSGTLGGDGAPRDLTLRVTSTPDAARTEKCFRLQN